MRQLIKEIIRIGRGDILPSGRESIFKITWAKDFRDEYDEIEYIIKGLHLIELKYRKINNNDFGIGSTSRTFFLIEELNEQNEKLAHDLYKWINSNGGNFYIPRYTLLTRKKQNEIIKTFNDEVSRLRELKKQLIQEKHSDVIKKQTQNSLARLKLLNLPTAKLLRKIEVDTDKPIHYYEESINNQINQGIKETSKNLMIELLKVKYIDQYPKKTKEIIENFNGWRSQPRFNP